MQGKNAKKNLGLLVRGTQREAGLESLGKLEKPGGREAVYPGFPGPFRVPAVPQAFPPQATPTAYHRRWGW